MKDNLMKGNMNGGTAQTSSAACCKAAQGASPTHSVAGGAAGAWICALTLILTLFCANASWAQDRTETDAGVGTVGGVVRDAETDQTLPGVNVLVAETNRGSTTDENGRYRIEDVAAGTYDLRASFVGYQDEIIEEVRVSPGLTTELNLELRPDEIGLDEVVVVGYGERRRRDLTGSVSSVSAEEIERSKALSVEGVLQGRAAGVDVTQTSGQPGGVARVRIRGGNSITAGNEPLYVIDGFPIYNDASRQDAGALATPAMNPLASLNPKDIAAIEVLKDASATAIYGSRGANGVVLITTKRGREGQNSISFESSVGVQQVRRTLPVLNAREYAQFVNEAQRPTYSEEFISNLGEGTDWQNEIFRTAPMQNHNLSVTGGNATTRYAISGGYTHQEGIIINSDFERASLRVNLDQDISDRFTVGNQLKVARTNAAVARTGTAGTGGRTVGGRVGIVSAAVFFNPIQPVRDPETGDYTFQNTNPGDVPDGYFQNVPYYNPVAYAELATNESITTRALGDIYAEYSLLDNLTLKSSFGADVYYAKQNRYEPSVLRLAASEGGRAFVGTVQDLTWLNENTLTYEKAFGQSSSINLLGGFTAQHFDQERTFVRAEGFTNDNLEFNDLSSASRQYPAQSGSINWSLLSYITRANYVFRDRYLFTGTARVDGSSRFGSGNKYGFFPSGSVAWRVSEEPFFNETGFLSDLKLRASYGLTGNQEIPIYQSLGALNGVRYPLGDDVVTGFSPTRIANPDLKWETTSQLDIGLDVAFLGQRLRVTTDYYRKVTDDLLLNVQVPATSGFTSSIQNVGSILNTGFELAINANVLEGDFGWDAQFNVAANRGEILDLGDEQERFVGGFSTLAIGGTPATVLRVGEPVGNFYGYETAGVFQTQGEVDAWPAQQAAAGRPAEVGGWKYVDQNGDGVVNPEDRIITGNAQPDFTGGFSSTFRYGGFDLSAAVGFSYGNDLYNIMKQELFFLNGRQNQSREILERWQPTNTAEENRDAVWPKTNSKFPFTGVDMWIEDGSYLRLRTLTLGYVLPVSKLSIGGLSQARLYVSAENLLTLTGYSGFDPEVNIAGQDNLRLGFDYGTYPTARTYTVGASLSF